MKNHIIMTVIIFLITLFFPFITLIEKDEKQTQNTTETVSVEQSTQTSAEQSAETVSVKVSATGKTEEMSAEEYVYGAVCAEMPASFHYEALKAQAVACYTYMKWLKENADNISPFKADITDSSAIHQAFITEEELKEKWGSSYHIYSEKVKEAVKSVMNEYLAYNGETAMTVFHGLSPGVTKSSAEVWKSDLPYLRSVTAPGDKLSPDFTSVVTLSEDDFAKPFGKADADALIKSAKKDTEGYISEISYNNKTLSATDLRSAYALKSPFFSIDKTDDGIVFTVYGKGHGVGMSQYSADYMARQGSTYKEILAHFYKGTELVTKE